jgi:hypothetical protein
LPPLTDADAPLTGGVFQVEFELQSPVAIEMAWGKAELPRVRETRRVSEKREQGLKAFVGIRWMREQRRVELKFVFIVIGTTSKRFLFVNGVIDTY